MILRVGLPSTTGALPGVAERAGLPVLVSANSMWRGDHFVDPGESICDLDCALDSSGFVAMHRYGGYRWTVDQYVELAGLHSWAWWAEMDYCCEPQVAGGRPEISRRVWSTASTLAACVSAARTWRAAGADWLQDPMPVLQGWEPDDYERSAELTTAVLGQLPAMVGVGSVCRRHWSGPDGLAAVVRRLDAVLPPGVGLHLFGVKGEALDRLRDQPRVVSADSMAWDFAARRTHGGSCTIEHRADCMIRWAEAQRPEPRMQTDLFLEQR